jgi:hypothetical protein
VRSWFRIDPGAAFDKKVEMAGNEAFGAWTRAGAWSAGNLTDGMIPRATAHKIAPRRVWERAIAAQLVEELPDGYKIHDYLDWNPSAEEVRAKSAKRSAAGRLGGKKSADARREALTEAVEPPPDLPPDQANAEAIASPIAQANAEAIAVSPVCARERSPSGISFHDSSLTGLSKIGDPVTAPAREGERHGQLGLLPEPVPEPKAKRGVKRLIPETWTPKREAFALGRELGFDDERVRFEGAQFRDNAKSSERMCVHWDPAFHNWLRVAKRREAQGWTGATRRSATTTHPASDLKGLNIATGESEEPWQ